MERSTTMPLSMYPEQPVSYCEECRLQIPCDHCWIGEGTMVRGNGEQLRTTILYSRCPGCRRRRNAPLTGPAWYRWLWGWLWSLRYSRIPPEAPEQDDSEQTRNRTP